MILNGVNGAAKGSDGMMEYFKNLTVDEIISNWKKWDFTDDFAWACANGEYDKTFIYTEAGYQPTQLPVLALFTAEDEENNLPAKVSIVFPHIDPIYQDLTIEMASAVRVQTLPEDSVCCIFHSGFAEHDGDPSQQDIHIECVLLGQIEWSDSATGLDGSECYVPVVYYKVF